MERVLHSGVRLPASVQALITALGPVPAGITVTDLEGRILYLNRRLLESLGYEADELVGREVTVLYGDSVEPEMAERILKATLAGGWQGEIVSRRKDGSVFPVYLETSSIRDEAGKPVVTVAVVRDITEERAFQDRMVAEARQGTFGVIAHNVAHEVRNHLSAIKMSLYMLEREDTPASERPTHFEIAREELDRIELFVRMLDNYANPPRPVFDPTSLVDAVNRGLEDARPFLLRKSISLFRQFPSRSPQLSIDREQFARAVSHVMENACEAVGEDGEIHVVIKRQPLPEGNWWLVEIRDNGRGVPPHLGERVFEPFFTTTRARLGLGLSNVRRILSLHGGGATLNSTPGRGTTVILRIPEKGEV